VYGALESVAVLWRLRSHHDIIIIIIMEAILAECPSYCHQRLTLVPVRVEARFAGCSPLSHSSSGNAHGKRNLNPLVPACKNLGVGLLVVTF